jgi:hypothetical protein
VCSLVVAPDTGPPPAEPFPRHRVLGTLLDPPRRTGLTAGRSDGGPGVEPDAVEPPALTERDAVVGQPAATPSSRWRAATNVGRGARHHHRRIRSLVVARPRHEHRPRHSPEVPTLVPYGVYLAELYAVICLALLLGPWDRWGRVLVVVVLAVLAFCGTAVLGRGLFPTWRETERAGGPPDAGGPRAIRPFGALALQLTPLAVLAVIFPLVGDRLHATTVGGTPLSAVLLAGSVAVPLMAQIACAPLYRVLGDEVYEHGPAALMPGFLAHWPLVFCRSTVLVALLCVPFALTAHWSMAALAGFALFMLCSVAMTQWFVVPIMERRYALWAGAWLAYAAVLVLAPAFTLVAPLAVVMVVAARMLRRPLAFAPRATPHVWRGFALGSVQGTLIWLNPLLLLLVSGSTYQPALVFLALLPALILFNAYFTMIAPGLQTGFDSFQHVLHRAGVQQLQTQAESLREQVRGKFVMLGLSVVGAAACAMIIESLRPSFNTRFYSALVICSVGFGLEAIFVYNLVQLKRDRLAVGLSLVHCVAFTAAMLVWSPTAAFYTVNAGVEVVLVTLLVLVYSREIAEPQYAVFWGHALSW